MHRALHVVGEAAEVTFVSWMGCTLATNHPSEVGFEVGGRKEGGREGAGRSEEREGEGGGREGIDAQIDESIL